MREQGGEGAGVQGKNPSVNPKFPASGNGFAGQGAASIHTSREALLGLCRQVWLQVSAQQCHKFARSPALLKKKYAVCPCILTNIPWSKAGQQSQGGNLAVMKM